MDAKATLDEMDQLLDLARSGADHRLIIRELDRLNPPSESKAERRDREVREERVQQKLAERERRAEEERKKQAVAANSWEAWQRWADARIADYLERHPLNAALRDVLGQVIAEERRDRRQEMKDAIDAAEQRLVTQIAALEERLLRSAGKLPVVREWRAESVFYQSELAAHEGSLWQAQGHGASSRWFGLGLRRALRPRCDATAGARHVRLDPEVQEA